MNDHVKVRVEDGVAVLSLDRPEKKNALSNAMYGKLADALTDANSASDTAAVLITSTSDSFTSGNDIADFAAVATGKLLPEDMNVTRFLSALVASENPIIAAVPGIAVGVGFTMLLHCDLVLLDETAQLSAPFVNLALVPEAGASRLLPNRIGHVRAFEIFGLGKPVSAMQALEWGLANKIVPAADLQAVALHQAKAIALKPRRAIRATKALMRDREAILAQMADEKLMFGQQLQSEEARNLFAGFLTKQTSSSSH
jgi:enoyl-CoA hydratase/carnithine racemase